MKKILFSLCTIFFATSYSLAQDTVSTAFNSFFGQESTFYHGLVNEHFDYGLSNYGLRVEGDTIINQKKYKFAFYRHLPYAGIPVNDNPGQFAFLLREDTVNGRLWVRFNDSINTELLIVDLSLNVGDTFNYIHPYMQRDTFFCNYYVDSVTIDSNGRNIHLHPEEDWMRYPHILKFMEGVGSSLIFNYLFSNTPLYVLYSVLACVHKDGEHIYQFANSYYGLMLEDCRLPSVGINNITEHDNIMVWPNPCINYLTISTAEGERIVEILDLKGCCVVREHINENDTKINVSSLPTGIYFLKIITKKQIKTVKLVKKHAL